MKRNGIPTTTAILALGLLLAMLFTGCGGKDHGAETAESAAPSDQAAPADPAGLPEPETKTGEQDGERFEAEPETETGRQDGERFETVIIMEGMEETVSYEHIRNDTIGFEMDYDYALFERHSEPDREYLVSRYDDPENPENYLEVQYSAEDADAVSASISGELSHEYAVNMSSYTLDRAGDCIRIDASATRDGMGTPDFLQMVYILPAPDGSRIAAAHYSFEASEGFGRRFAYFMHTFSVIPSHDGSAE